MLLAPIEAGGGGMPDVRAELLAEIAVDTVTMLHSSRAAVRETALWKIRKLPHNILSVNHEFRK